MQLHETKKSEYFPNPKVPIGLWRMPDQQPMRNHDHDFLEIAVVAAGSGEHSFSGTVLPASSGDVFVVNAGEKHSWKKTYELDVINIMISDLEAIPEIAQLRSHPAFDALFFHEPHLRDRQKGRGRLHLNIAELNEVIQIAKRLNNAIHKKKAPYPLIATVILLDLLSLLCESYMAAPQKEQQVTLRIGKAVRHLEMNWSSPPDHEELASIINVSVPTFYRLFRNATGTTPNNYLNRLRVKEASVRLRDTDQSITAIAYDIGFSDSNYFSTIFRKVQGMSPRQFRQNAVAPSQP